MIPQKNRPALALRAPGAKLKTVSLTLHQPSQKGPMKSYLKIFALVFAVAASAAVLSACSHNDNPPPPPPAPAPEMVRPNS